MVLCLKGVCYIRTGRQESAIIYNSDEDFHVGQAKVRTLTCVVHLAVNYCKTPPS